MTVFEAAWVIDSAFPRHPILSGRNNWLQTTSVIEALEVARIESGYNELGTCIEWAREYLKWHRKED